jgi:hypothetical protein
MKAFYSSLLLSLATLTVEANWMLHRELQEIPGSKVQYEDERVYLPVRIPIVYPSKGRFAVEP